MHTAARTVRDWRPPHRACFLMAQHCCTLPWLDMACSCMGWLLFKPPCQPSHVRHQPALPQASGSLLFLSCIGIILPTAAERLVGMGGGPDLPQESVLLISRIAAIGLLAM